MESRYRVPDLGVTCSPDMSSHATPEPVLLIEVLSPGNFAQTRSNMWTYTTIPSVAEILIVHSTRVEAALLRRGFRRGVARRREGRRSARRARARQHGFSIPLASLYRIAGL